MSRGGEGSKAKDFQLSARPPRWDRRWTSSMLPQAYSIADDSLELGARRTIMNASLVGWSRMNVGPTLCVW